ncbi:MAG: hypothetical protein ABSH20_00945 [Tepidisphaeraceae bacterium]|jgi:hypothetical protein
MRFQIPNFKLQLLLVVGVLGMAGCAENTAVSHGHNTALDSVDMVSMTDQMARSMAGDERVRQTIARKGKLVVVVQPVENQLTGEILPAGQAELFTARVRMLLSKHAPESFTWVMNRDAFYRLQARERDLDLGPAPERAQPEFALTATFRSLTDETTKRRTAAYLCVYELTNLNDRTLVWNDRYEVKKTAVKGFLD